MKDIRGQLLTAALNFRVVCNTSKSNAFAQRAKHVAGL